ncbi:hypothetical protein GCM10022631_09850 [Deinococcus rubellus]
MDASVVQHHHDLSWDVGQDVLEEANNIGAFEGPVLSLLEKLASSGHCTDG